jgi:murein DD-endopeptidase MepM/ murein hydrolase activator NlpD
MCGKCYRRPVRWLLLTLPWFSLACAGDHAPCPPCKPEAVTTEVSAVAERAFALLEAGDAAGLRQLFNSSMKAAVSADQTAAVVASVARQDLRAIEPIDVGAKKGNFRLRAAQGDWNLEVAIDDAGAIAGMLVKPAEGSGPPVARSEVPLGLPFRGTWSVVWGGDTRELNHHVDSPSQRRAADLVQVDDSGATHRGDGRANRDYLAYGKEVLAVADGVVVTAVDGVPDNQPGEMNTMFVPGNLVIIEHAGGVWSAYAHLVPGSLAVKVGAKVRRGQLLGRCGNSGNSSEPHLHFQVEDGPRFEKSWGIEPVFAAVEVTRDGVRERPETYTWRKGDQVHAP